MDDNYSGDSFGGSSQSQINSSAESCITALVNNAVGFESAGKSSSVNFHHDNTGTKVVETNAPKKKRVSRKGGGLRQFSAIVCNVLESKGKTTYAEVADDVISDFPGNDSETATPLSESEANNIRRRVYDALNVFEALDIITREKKQIKWKGHPDRNIMDLEGMKAECLKLMNRIGRKTAYLKDLEEQFADLQSLMLHNKQLLKSGNTSPEGFSLPFILAQTSIDATVEIEISEDMQMVHLDFNSTPFSLHDDTSILKLLRRHQKPERANVTQSSSFYSSSPRTGIASSGGTTPFH